MQGGKEEPTQKRPEPVDNPESDLEDWRRLSVQREGEGVQEFLDRTKLECEAYHRKKTVNQGG